MTENIYWASKPSPELAGEVLKRFDEHVDTLRRTGVYGKICKVYQRYYGETEHTTSSGITAGGEVGELSLVYMNELRTNTQHLLSKVVGRRLSYDVSPKNNDAEAREQSIFGQALLESYVKSLRLDYVLRSAAEMALVYTFSYVRLDWDSTLGEEYAVDEAGNILYNGDVRVDLFTPFEVAQDWTSSPTDKPQWRVIREPVNRWDLAAQFPEHQAKIKALPPVNEGEQRSANPFKWRLGQTPRSDKVHVYRFYHRRTPALPDGRETFVLDKNTVITDGPLSYADIPVYRMSPSEMFGTPYGYSPLSDALGPYDAMNATISAVLSNQMAFGVQNVAIPRGANPVAHQLVGGLNLIEWDIGKPEALQLCATPPELYQSIDMFRGFGGSIQGVSPASRGEIDKELSGDALALLDSRTLEFAGPLQESYTDTATRVGQGVIDLLKTRATTPRVSRILGKDKAYMSRTFASGDLDGVDLVTVEMGNPLSRTFAGRYSMARELLGQGMIRNPEQYLEVIDTGKIEPVLESPRSEMLNIKRENELLAKGIPSTVVMTDSHVLHIMEHKCVLDSPESRANPEVIAVYTQHQMEHMIQLATANPILMQILGQQPAMFNQQLQATQRGEPDAQGGGPGQPDPSMNAPQANQNQMPEAA